MKTIKKIEEKGYKVITLNYKHAATGQRLNRKGYAICKENGYSSHRYIRYNGKSYPELFTLEPCRYSNGDKWMLTGENIQGVKYLKRVQEILNYI